MLANSLTKHCTTDEIFQNFSETSYLKFSHLMLVTVKAKRKDEDTEGDLERMTPTDMDDLDEYSDDGIFLLHEQ
eukprot:4007287-Pyramimonas_sp.AAC.1